MRGMGIVAIVCAAWGTAACGGQLAQGSDAGGAGSGNPGATTTSPASGSVENPSSGTATSGSTAYVPGSGVSLGPPSGGVSGGLIGGAGSILGGQSGPETGGSGSLFGGASGTVISGGAGLPFGGAQSGTGTVVTSGSFVGSTGDVDAQAFCGVPAANAGSLPFIVDSAFVPSGWMGDAPAYAAMAASPVTGAPAFPGTTARMTLSPQGYSMIGDACTPDGIGRSSAEAKGTCWKVVFVPFPKTLQPGFLQGTFKVGGGPGYGWAGAFWQYPRNNWGSLGGGYPIPPGATTVSFWVRGHDGGEALRFFTGEGLNIPCSDYVATTSTNVYLPNTPAWARYTIDIAGLSYDTAGLTPGQGPGGYFGGVLGAFGFGVGDQTLPSLDGGSAPPNETDPTSAPVADPAVLGKVFPPFFESTITFYIDDIEFQ